MFLLLLVLLSWAGSCYSPIALTEIAQAAAEEMLEDALKTMEEDIEREALQIMEEAAEGGEVKGAQSALEKSSVSAMQQEAAEALSKDTMMDQLKAAATDEERAAIIKNSTDDVVRRHLSNEVWPEDPEQWYSSSPATDLPADGKPVDNDIWHKGEDGKYTGTYFEEPKGSNNWKQIDKHPPPNERPMTKKEGPWNTYKEKFADAKTINDNWEVDDNPRAQDPKTGEYNDDPDGLDQMHKELDEMDPKDLSRAENGGSWFKDEDGDWKQIKKRPRGTDGTFDPSASAVPKLSPESLVRALGEVGTQAENQLGEGAADPDKASKTRRECGEGECGGTKFFGELMMFFSMGFTVWKMFFSKPNKQNDYPKIWSYSPIPSTELCWPSPAVYQDPGSVTPIPQVSSDDCIQSCFQPPGSCKAVTYYQADDKKPSQCFHLPRFDPNQLRTQPPVGDKAIMTTYDCNEYRATTRHVLLNETGCFDYTGVQLPDKSCLDCPGMVPGKMCLDDKDSAVPCSTSPSTHQCEDLNNCTYLKTTCPDACAAASTTQKPTHWVDRIAAVRNLAYVGCYNDGEFPPTNECLNGKCTDSTLTDRDSCLKARDPNDSTTSKNQWCSGCPYQQICGMCPPGHPCPEKELQNCYDLMCKCPPDASAKGTCGSIMEAGSCTKDLLKKDVVWRGAQDLATLCMPPACWVDGVPDESYDDEQSCTQKPNAAWIDNGGRTNIAGKPCPATTPTPGSPGSPGGPGGPGSGKSTKLPTKVWIGIGVGIAVVVLAAAIGGAASAKQSNGDAGGPPPGASGGPPGMDAGGWPVPATIVAQLRQQLPQQLP